LALGDGYASLGLGLLLGLEFSSRVNPYCSEFIMMRSRSDFVRNRHDGVPSIYLKAMQCASLLMLFNTLIASKTAYYL